MNAEQLALLESELKRDLEAVARVRRLIESKQSAETQPERPLSAPSAMSADTDIDVGPVTSLRGTIDQVINADPNVKWTVAKMLSHLQSIKFDLQAQKPIYSVGQAMKILADKGRIRVVRKGVGSAPNVYKGISKDEPSATATAEQQELPTTNFNLQ